MTQNKPHASQHDAPERPPDITEHEAEHEKERTPPEPPSGEAPSSGVSRQPGSEGDR